MPFNEYSQKRSLWLWYESYTLNDCALFHTTKRTDRKAHKHLSPFQSSQRDLKSRIFKFYSTSVLFRHRLTKENTTHKAYVSLSLRHPFSLLPLQFLCESEVNKFKTSRFKNSKKVGGFSKQDLPVPNHVR